MATATSADSGGRSPSRLISLVSAAAAASGSFFSCELLQVGAALAVLVALFAQFLLQHLQALVQEHPALLPLEAVVHALGDLVLERDELVLLDEDLEQQQQARLGIVALEQLLLAVGADHEVGGDDVHHAPPGR